jgi:hypothetical protein
MSTDLDILGGDSGVGKADSTLIFSAHVSRGLGVAGARQDGAEIAGYLAVSEHRSMFGLGDSRDNDRNEGTKAVDGGVATWARGVSRIEVVDPPGDAFGVWAGQERGIRVHSKTHVRRTADEMSEGVLGGTTKQTVSSGHDGKSGGRLLAGEGTNSLQHRVITRDSAVQHRTNNCL